MSRCQTILVDTVTEYRGSSVRRLIAIRISRRYDILSGKEKGRYTGRHWWGVSNGSTALEPITGKQALDLAMAIGLPERGKHDYGTSIMLLDPDFSDIPASGIVKMVCETLLWNFWPKFINYDAQFAAMRFRFALNGVDVPIPAVENCPPLDLFVAAMKDLKSDRNGVKSIGSKSPKKHLGKLSIKKMVKGDRKILFTGDNSLAPLNCSHVALMRPAELVVKYLEGQPLPTDDYEWAGVFICDGDEEVEHAFAASEPPAHDDWIPNYLPKGRQKTFVNVALREIKRHMRNYAGPITLTGGGAGGYPSLASLGDALGSKLLGVSGQGIGGDRKPRGSSGQGRRNPVKLTKPRFQSLKRYQGKLCALFEMELTGPKRKNVTITGHPGILVDGGGTDSSSQDGVTPEVVEWRSGEGDKLGSGKTVEIKCTGKDDLVAYVTVPGYVAVSFSAKVVSK
jgi:hypothetical protein